MEESKKAAKAFVDQHFPVKKQASKPTDIWAELLQSNSKKEFSEKKVYYVDGSNNSSCLNSHSGIAGCQDSYPYSLSSPDDFQYNPDCRYPGPSYYNENKDRKESLSYEISEPHGGAEWWQGSFYY